MPIVTLLLWLLLGLLAGLPAAAAPAQFELANPLPPVIADTMTVPNCTVTWLVSDIATNDTLAVRMRIAPGPETRAINDVMPCPPIISPRVAIRALDACTSRAADPKDCVYTDMGREFDKRPTANNSAENTSRCASDRSSDIGVACYRAGALQICGVACGDSPAAAISAAVSRCESKHQTQCPLTGSLPVLAPK